jgi:hypothetical protein
MRTHYESETHHFFVYICETLVVMESHKNWEINFNFDAQTALISLTLSGWHYETQLIFQFIAGPEGDLFVGRKYHP